ncbi:SH3 domain-containing protein [Vannielia litorea]|uniref:SH3 domain-containing protein n=1 Tax=Vannielia litorea TaxID=1217970 RepID=UPI001BCFEE07|nr:SH3 domain-containing protein [Vannielia litorea]
MMKFTGLILAALMAAAPVAAQDRTEQVQFAAGTSGTTINDTVSGRDAVLYKLGASAGQEMHVSLTSNNAATYFNIYAPGKGPGDEAMAIGELSDTINDWRGALPSSGEYTVMVFLYRSAARRGESANYTLNVSIGGESSAQVQGDYADGLAGGPDFYEVSVGGGDTLNMRAGPSTGEPVVTKLASGTQVRNLGCQMSEGQRWCRIATLADPGYEGWAAGRYLIEGTGQAAAPSAPQGDMPTAAEQACLRDVTAVTNNPDVVLLGSEFSQAGTMVRVGVGPDQAPWQCIAYEDGTTAEIMSLTDEGSL